MSKNCFSEIVGGDAYIAPQDNLSFFEDLRRIRSIYNRADVGIGPYG